MTQEPSRRPPMPPLVFKYVMNPLMTTLLVSPFHGRISDRLMLLRFTGRKSGKRYSIPVGYFREGNELTLFTHSAWRKNLEGGAPVSVRIQGKDYDGYAELVGDYATVKKMVQDRMARDGKEMAQRMGYWVDNPDPSPEELRQATLGTYFVRIQLNETPA